MVGEPRSGPARVELPTALLQLHMVHHEIDHFTKVRESLLQIPLGKAVTYSDIAQKIGQPTASRAVGAAVGRNPISFVVPCHRALGKSGALTGYRWGVARKQALLAREAKP